MQRKNIKQIAALARVSVSTVSRVLNDMPDVNKATRQRVLEVIKNTGYTPNTSARSLKQIYTRVIAVIAKGIGSLFFSPIIEDIQRDLVEAGYIPYICYIDEREEEISVATRILAEKKAEGIIILGGNINDKKLEIERLEVPCIFVTVSAERIMANNAYSVSVQDKMSAKLAVDYLFNLGHTDIAVVGGLLGERDVIYDRYEGVMESFIDHGQVFSKASYIQCKFSLLDGYEAVSIMLKERNIHPTALFVMSDVMAIGAMKAITDIGLSVPKDISVIGYDGIAISQFYNPTLTTIRQPAEQLAKTSVRLILEALEGAIETRHISLDTQLLVGKSTCKHVIEI